MTSNSDLNLDTTYYVTYGDDSGNGQQELSSFIRDVIDATIEESADGRYFIRGDAPLRGGIPPLPPSEERPLSARGEFPPSVVGGNNVQRPKSSRGVRGERPLSSRGARDTPPSSGDVQRPISSDGTRGGKGGNSPLKGDSPL